MEVLASPINNNSKYIDVGKKQEFQYLQMTYTVFACVATPKENSGGINK